MPEEPGTVADAPNPPEGAPEEGTAEQPADVNWQQRYEDLRPQANRWESENQQFQQLFEDPTLLARAVQATGLDQNAFLEALGYGVPEDEEEDIEYDDDPNAELAQRLEALEAQTAQQAQAEEAAQLEDLGDQWFNKQMTEISDAEGRELSEKEAAAAELWGERNLDENGIPDYKAGWEQAKAFAQEQRSIYLQSKRASGVAAGTAGEESIDWSDPEAAHKAATDAVQAVLEAEEG